MQAGDAAADLCAAEAGEIPPRGRAVVPTGLAIALPQGTRGRIMPRSGLAMTFGIDVGAGLIDSGYRGEIGVLLFNHGDTPFRFAVGDRIAQLAIEPSWTPAFTETSVLDPTNRSEGWGSTGTETP
jgi:dUTP pyrophosphatase